MSSYHKTAGYTLIEMMIAMLIGVVVLVSLLQISITSKKNFRLSNQASLLQENLRFSTRDINKIVRMSGFRSSPWVDTEQSFQADTTFTIPGQVVFGVDGATTSDSDSLSLRFQGDGDGVGNPSGDIIDCIGSELDSEDIAIISLDITASGFLRCTSTNETTGDTQSVNLVGNIENMQLLYGIDSDDDLYVDEYITATAATTGASWRNVVSVRLALLLKSDSQIFDKKKTSAITLNNHTLASTEDRYMRMQSTTTIALRNNTP